jgi:hypothetical protein
MASRDHFRAFARRPVHLSAAVGFVDGSWQETARIKDLGLGGARLELGEALASGTPIRVQLVAPHLWDPLEVRARVAWAREAQGPSAAQVGLCFEHQSGKTLRWLVALLKAENFE